MLLEYWQYSYESAVYTLNGCSQQLYADILTNESDRKVTKRQILGKIIPAGQQE